MTSIVLNKLDDAVRNAYDMEDNLGPNREQKHQEGIMVFDSDTVVDPWAMMVKSFNTDVADSTMSRSGRADDLAFWT